MISLSSIRTLRKLSSFHILLLSHSPLPVSPNPILFPSPSLLSPSHPSVSLFSTTAALFDNSTTTTSKCSPISVAAAADEECSDPNHRYTDAYAAVDLALDSVVKIFTVSSSPNYFLPWQNKSQRETMGSADWWERFGDRTPQLTKFAVRVLSLTCSASGCERNWSTFEQIHTKKRNRLEQQKLNSLVYVMYNMKLRERSMKRRAAMDPILVDHIESDDEWIAEKEGPVLPTDPSWLEDQNMAFDISAITTIPESDDPVDSNAPSTSNISEGDCPPPSSRKRKATTLRFVLPGRRILTNAHVVADHTFVLVRKHGSPTKYRAEVQAIGHECDLALLIVKSEEFWEGMHFLELGDIPFLQEAVAVVGYPQGGDNISVTKGVVSRVEPTQYVHGATQLMAIQIDAAINPGNSGGPAIMGDKVAGVAFQNLSGAENIGYIIPVPVIKHFIAGVEETGKYVGFCSMGLSCQPTENVQLREHFQMRPEMTGVLVSKINPLSDAHRLLKKDDIILTFDGVPIANDGTVPFRNRERITFDHLVSMKKPNETSQVRVLRDGVEHEFSIILRPLQPLVPVHQFDKLPSYYIFAGLVFIPLTQPYLHEYGEDWYNTSPRRLCERALRELPRKAGEQLVILSQVLMDDVNAGYERLAELQVKKVNGDGIKNLKHLCELVENCKQENLRFDLDDERVVVLNYHSARVATSRILKRHRIPAAMSADLIDERNVSTELEAACLNST